MQQTFFGIVSRTFYARRKCVRRLPFTGVRAAEKVRAVHSIRPDYCSLAKTLIEVI